MIFRYFLSVMFSILFLSLVCCFRRRERIYIYFDRSNPKILYRYFKDISIQTIQLIKNYTTSLFSSATVFFFIPLYLLYIPQAQAQLAQPHHSSLQHTKILILYHCINSKYQNLKCTIDY